MRIAQGLSGWLSLWPRTASTAPLRTLQQQRNQPIPPRPIVTASWDNVERNQRRLHVQFQQGGGRRRGSRCPVLQPRARAGC